MDPKDRSLQIFFALTIMKYAKGISLFIITLLISIVLSNFFLLNNYIISPAFFCIMVGLLVGNLVTFSKHTNQLISFILTNVLKVGIALLGIGLSIHELFKYGLSSVLLIIINILLVFAILILLGKCFKISKNLIVLIFMGTSICGVTAIAATSTIIKSNQHDTGYAVGVVTVFGLIAVVAYPYMAHYMFNGNDINAGIFLGAAIHDTAQVSAAGLIYQETFSSPVALEASMTTKLLRNSFLIILIPLLTYFYDRKKTKNKSSIVKFFPFFVLGFILLSLARTTGDIFIINTNYHLYWENLIMMIKIASKYMILISMVALGLQIKISSFKKIGLKPLLVGFVAAISVGLSSLIYLN
jgi:uncharacterized integral membrane protein (TIGR00698 family)